MGEVLYFVMGFQDVKGRAVMSKTTIRALEKATDRYLAAFTLTNIMIYDQNDLS